MPDAHSLPLFVVAGLLGVRMLVSRMPGALIVGFVIRLALAENPAAAPSVH